MANWETWNVQCRLIPGAEAGDHDLSPGFGGQAVMKSDATILSVRHISADLQTNDDLTAEFSRSSDTVINNDGGTSSADDFLVVTWAQSWD